MRCLQAAEMGCLITPNTGSCVVSSILAPHHHHSSSSSLSLLQTLGHQSCQDTVIYVLYFYSPPFFLHNHRSNMIHCQKKKKTFLWLPPLSSSFKHSHPHLPSKSPTTALLPSTTPPILHPSPPITPGLYLCVSCVPVCSCMPKVRYCSSRNLQQQPSLCLLLTLSLTPSIQSLLVNTFLPVLINFFSFQWRTYTHTCTHIHSS